MNLIPFVLCTLLVITNAAAVDLQAFAQNAATVPPNDRNPPPDAFMAKGRLTVHVPTRALSLGVENAFEIVLKGPALHSLTVVQGQTDSSGNPAVDLGDNAGEEVPLQRRPNGTVFVNVKPVAPGTIQFGFIATFIDGGHESETTTAKVVASRSSRKLEIDSMLFGDRSMQYMEVGQQKILWIKA